MRYIIPSFLAGALLLAAGIAVGQLGLVSFGGPSLPEFNQVEVAVTVPDEARIVGVESIALDCRARVHAEVPVEGTREHRLFGQTYRTDTVTLTAVGDVDTCVDGSSAVLTRHRDGTTEVVIDGSSIVFVRPRVDAVATADSVNVDQGFVGELTDVVPWVDDDLGLTPLAYAYAQTVIGSSECMRTAYTVTEELLIEAYREQFIEQGVDPDTLTVRIEGEPDFDDPAPVELEGVRMQVGSGAVTCVASDDLGGVTRLSEL